MKKKGEVKARIIQMADDSRTLPNGSKVIYAESDDKIVLYHKAPFEKGITYMYERTNGKIYVNNVEGSNKEKRKMIELGSYFMKNCKDDDLITINVCTKEEI
ncbi:hypothetical protein ACFL96_01965 [Thermoproteota archaeon]